MAKQKRSLFELSGTLGAITFVHTRKGTVVRRARGTVKEAVCNARLREESDKNTIVAAAAKLVHDVVKQHAGVFKKSDLWQDLLSRVRKCRSEDPIVMLQSIQGTEINTAHPLEKILPSVRIETTYESGMMTVVLHNNNVNVNPGVAVNCYCCELFVITADERLAALESIVFDTGWADSSYPVQRTETSFALHLQARYCAVLLKVSGGRNGNVGDDKKVMGMRVMEVMALKGEG